VDCRISIVYVVNINFGSNTRMKKFILMLFLLLPEILCFGQTYSDVISDSEIVSFLTWEVNSTKGSSKKPLLSFRRKIDKNIGDWDSLNFIRPNSLNETSSIVSLFYLFQNKNGLDSIFNSKDKKYLFEQYKSLKIRTWQKKIPKAKITTNENLNYYCYSIPLFSIDKKYVVVKRVYYCGNVCLSGAYYIYKRQNDNTWEFVKAINSWMS